MKRLNLIFLIPCLMISACTAAPLVMPTTTLEATPTHWFPPTLTPSPASTPKPTETLTPPPSSATLRPTLSSMTTPTNSDLGKLAYIQDSDIWVKSLPNGQPQRLTTDGHHHEPHWSSSGQWLAFRTGESQVWVMRADGSAHHPLNESKSIKDFAWAPNIDRLAFTTDDRALLAVNADGSDRQAFVMPDSRQPITGVQSLAWSPDGQWLAVVRGEILKEGAPPDRYDSVWRVRVDSSEAIELLNGGRPSDREFIVAGWSSDSSTILLWINPGYSGSALADGVPLYALSVKGNSLVQLVADLDTGSGPRAKIVLAHSDFVAPAPANFAATHIALTVGDYRATWTNKRIGIADVRTGKIGLLTSKDQAAFSPDWSPDGGRLAYVAMPDKGDLGGGEDARLGMMNRRISIVSAQGDPQPRQLTNDSAYRDERPLWSADGLSILFARLDRENQSSVWLVSAQGGEPQRIVDELTPAPEWFGYYGYIDWNDLFDWWRGSAGLASSLLVKNFLWQTDGLYGYRMLRPAGWEAVDMKDRRGYRPPGLAGQADQVLLMAFNLQVIAKATQSPTGLIAQWSLFERDHSLDGWTGGIEQMWASDGLEFSLVRTLPHAKVYLLKPSAASDVIELAAFAVDDDQPLTIGLEAYGAYADERRLQQEGILDDFATMVASISAVQPDPTNIDPALKD